MRPKTENGLPRQKSKIASAGGRGNVAIGRNRAYL
jgi:hypothetical protein